MSINVILGILLAGVLSNNYAMLHFLGGGTVLCNRRSTVRSLILGLGTTLVMVLCTLAIWPINTYFLGNASYLQIMAFMIVLIVVVEVLHLVAGKLFDGFCRADFVHFAVNTAVLALCINNTSLAYGEAIVTALGVGLGFTVALMLYSRLRDAVYDEEAIPAAFRGLPVSLLTAGMIVLALMALNF